MEIRYVIQDSMLMCMCMCVCVHTHYFYVHIILSQGEDVTKAVSGIESSFGF